MARLEDELLNYKSPYIIDGNEKLLVNKLEIQNEADLEQAERMITNFKLAKLYLDPGKQTFDVEHYLRIHKCLFEDIYSFAGELRTETIQKRIPFCLPNYILSELKKTLNNAWVKSKSIDTREKLIDFITELYSDLDVIHPFREGNGRTEREFMRQFIDYICIQNHLEPYYLDYGAISDKNIFIEALVRADAYLEIVALKLYLIRFWFQKKIWNWKTLKEEGRKNTYQILTKELMKSKINSRRSKVLY